MIWCYRKRKLWSVETRRRFVRRLIGCGLRRNTRRIYESPKGAITSARFARFRRLEVNFDRKNLNPSSTRRKRWAKGACLSEKLTVLRFERPGHPLAFPVLVQIRCCGCALIAAQSRWKAKEESVCGERAGAVFHAVKWAGIWDRTRDELARGSYHTS